jgi:hypothetical protein
MKAMSRILSTAAMGLSVAFALMLCPVQAFAQGGKRKNPTSKLYVTDANSQAAEINNGEKVDDLLNKSVHSADGATIETKADSKDTAIVLSNSTGVFFDPDTKVEMQRFMQEPFTPNRTDMDTEPSISQTQAMVSRGSVGLCTPNMVAGSSMVYSTPHASVAIRGRKVVIQTSDNETVVSLLEGDVTVRGDQFTGGETLKAGQQAVIRRTSPTAPPTISIRPIPPSQMPALNDRVDAACTARQKVYFEQVDPKTLFTDGGEPQPEIVPKEVVKPSIKPKITVSASSIDDDSSQSQTDGGNSNP